MCRKQRRLNTWELNFSTSCDQCTRREESIKQLQRASTNDERGVVEYNGTLASQVQRDNRSALRGTVLAREAPLWYNLARSLYKTRRCVIYTARSACDIRRRIKLSVKPDARDTRHAICPI